MRMTEDELQALLSRNKSLKANYSTPHSKVKNKDKSVAKIKPMFDSLAEEKYYNEYLFPLLLIKEIESVELHRKFTLIEAIPEYKIKKIEYTPDFIIHYPNSSIKVVEIKGKVIKKLQRDYHIRKSLFIRDYVIPNGWTFEEIIAEDITGNESRKC
jgi:hypothetical protein